MPHFTVTKVEDPEEGAAASISQEPSLADIKARIQDSDEPGEYATWELLEPIKFFVKEVTRISKFKMPSLGEREVLWLRCFSVTCFTPLYI